MGNSTVDSMKESKTKRVPIIPIAIAIGCSIIIFILAYFSYIQPKIIKPMQEYNSAVELLKNGNYEEAKTIFKSLGEYKDSVTQIDNCEIAYADSLAEKEDYYGALKIYEKYPDNPNVTEEKLKECKESIYQDAISYYQKGNYDYAISEFEFLSGYSDSEEYIEKCEDEKRQREEEEKKAAEKAAKKEAAQNEKDKKKLIGTWYARKIINYRDEDITDLMSDLNKIYFTFNEDGTGKFQLSDSEHAKRMGEKGNFTWKIEDVDGYGDDAIGTWTFKGYTETIFYYDDYILMYTEDMDSIPTLDVRLYCYKR